MKNLGLLLSILATGCGSGMENGSLLTPESSTVQTSRAGTSSEDPCVKSEMDFWYFVQQISAFADQGFTRPDSELLITESCLGRIKTIPGPRPGTSYSIFASNTGAGIWDCYACGKKILDEVYGSEE